MEKDPFLVSTSTAQPDRAQWVERTWAEIDPDRLGALLANMVGIPSPSGEEKPLATFLANYMANAGLQAEVQTVRDVQANALGRLDGTGGGPSLLLYAPIDTAFTGHEDEDLPMLGEELRPDFRPQTVRNEDWIIGLGAENPKAFAACIVAAAEAVSRAGIPMQGSVLVGLGAGGMPTNRPPRLRDGPPVGHGVGCAYMLDSGFRGDFAVVCKPGYAVAWEEVGISWFRLRVHGKLGYTGVRHLLPYRSPIVDATSIIQAIEAWLPSYTERFTSGLVAPRGAIGAIAGGWPYKPAFTPAICDVWLDLRLSPRATIEEVEGALSGVLNDVRAQDPDLDVDCERLLAIPGTQTDPQNWIIRSAIRAWERVEGRSHEPIKGTSGATDAAILRGHGLPTARLGMPRPATSPPHPGYSMGQANVKSMVTLVKCLTAIVIDTCTRSRADVGLRS